jgi:ketosteroid isomerase-like protein
MIIVEERERDLAVLRDHYARWARGDFSGGEVYADDLVWLPRELDGGEYGGVEQATAQWRGFLQSFSLGFRIEAEEIIPSSGDRYLVMQRFHGIGKASGVETEGRNALLITMRDGKIARMEGFWDIAAALRVAGIDVDHL